METIKYPSKSSWTELLKRPLFDVSQLYERVKPILEDVRTNDDTALRKLEKKFDKAELTSLLVTSDEFAEAEALLSNDLKQSIIAAHDNISKFHSAQKFEPIQVETMPGITCQQRSIPISKVGLYVPGGTAPLLSTVLMLATPARIAGCQSIILCTPPNSEGKVNPAVLFTAQLTGVGKVYKVGGAQAIAAMAYGTESIQKVDKIFGPGNQYVTAAKQLVSITDVAIDMPAGPSEVEVLADSTASPAFVAADLLSQAEHGVDSQAVLITTDETLISKVSVEIESQLQQLPRKEIAAKSLANSKMILVKNINEAIEITNEYAPEHLIVATKDYNEVAMQITHAGSIFLGNYSCESAGDYASGTNHTLPTKGYAKAYSGLCLDSFMRKITYQELTPQGILNLGHIVETMAAAEQLDAHKNAISIRLAVLNK